MKKKVLVVEDESAIVNLIKEVLEAQNYMVVVASDGIEGYQKFSDNSFDLVITDAMMPNLDGFGMITMIRNKDKSIPIIMLTALEDEYDQIKGFESGADDYISKPFSITVLLKRIEAVLRRNKAQSLYELGDLLVNFEAHTLTYEGQSVELTAKEFAILKYLIENKNCVVNRNQILENVWGYDYYGDIRNVDTHMKNLRKKLPLKNIITVKGVGYNFVV